MACLIHLNGPSRVGKSTVARRLAAEHPGVLNLDLDAMVAEVDGWRDDFPSALAVTRQRGIAIAIDHLGTGNDVVLPQLITSFDASPWAEAVAAQARADYVEIALLADGDVSRNRVREKEAEHAVDVYLREALTGSDSDLLERIHGDLARYLADRPATARVDTSALTVEQTYSRVLDLLRSGTSSWGALV
ncbi:AAA family ATPase [Mycetocola zhujimingii]|uniref:Uncharacterized protein n=1 Tax=Mycetocola zhujimingii TaxID=2079792 RepID=A0A2U1TFX1_9MICO|nr:AAA family ATPase [Mycetocola zhujimingii]PWC07797.1 hypothetical protein DF223_00025 [Mycetocola zhujimingii]